VPVHEHGKPTIRLSRVHDAGLFEGTTDQATKVFAYDLAVTWPDGRQSRARDAYSFLPTVGETDLYLFAQGNERRIFEKLGAHLREPDGVAGASFAVWAPHASR
jgi:1,4-alpha-glucan branching enzyme